MAVPRAFLPATGALGLAVAVASVWAFLSCTRVTEDIDPVWTTDVVIHLDVDAGGRWTVTPSPGEEAEICPTGFSQEVAWLDPVTGEEFSVADRRQLAWAVPTAEELPAVIMVVELTCADGSGTFAVELHTEDGSWQAATGVGAYQSLGGSGTVTPVPDERGDLTAWHLRGTLHSGRSDYRGANNSP